MAAMSDKRHRNNELGCNSPGPFRYAGYVPPTGRSFALPGASRGVSAGIFRPLLSVFLLQETSIFHWLLVAPRSSLFMVPGAVGSAVLPRH